MRRGAHRGEVGQVAAHQFMRKHRRRFIADAMHAGDDAVGGGDKLRAGRKRQYRRIIRQAERPLAGKRCEITCDAGEFVHR